MESIKNKINSYLSNLKGTGNFCSIGSTEFVFPQLYIKSFGEISLPINEIVAKSLISKAYKAPFGKGMETIVDTNVRSAWQIDSSEIYFEGDSWTKYLDKIITKIKNDLGINHADVSAHLYKLLIYEEGDFFLKHKDTEKEKGMFGSLVIGLPSTFKGGELEITFEDTVEIADFSKNPYQINFTAFYADCDHEVKPLLSGYRVCLVYNLVHEKSDKTLSASASKEHIENMVSLLSNPIENKPFVILLGHQYTPENFSLEQLKLNDRLKADVLLKAADKLGYYSNLCLVTSYLSGSPDCGSYGYYDDDDDDEDAEMGEIYDESLGIEHWLTGNSPKLGNLNLENEDLIASFPINEGDPIEKENTGYMGNYGPDLNHWYHYGAVVIWSKELNSQIIATKSADTKLIWIDYALNNYSKLTNFELSKIKEIISEGIGVNESNSTYNYDVVADWVLNFEANTFFQNCEISALKHYFVKISSQKWFEILEKTSTKYQCYLFENVLNNTTLASVLQWTNVACLCIEQGKFIDTIKEFYAKFDIYLTPFFENKKNLTSTITSSIIKNAIILDKFLFQNEAHQNKLMEILTNNPTREYLNTIIIPTLLTVPVDSTLSKSLLIKSLSYLQEIVNNKPLPPQTWRREVPKDTYYTKQWAILKAFLEDENMISYEIKAVQQVRHELESAINNVQIDLQTETIKKGSPHTLRITKTQDAYLNALKKWQEDVNLLEKTKQEIKKLGF